MKSNYCHHSPEKSGSQHSTLKLLIICRHNTSHINARPTQDWAYVSEFNLTNQMSTMMTKMVMVMGVVNCHMYETHDGMMGKC